MEPNTQHLTDIYSREIRPLSLADQLSLAQKIISEAAVAARRQPSRSLLDLEGLGAEAWGDLDAQSYVEELHSEWDDRV